MLHGERDTSMMAMIEETVASWGETHISDGYDRGDCCSMGRENINDGWGERHIKWL